MELKISYYNLIEMKMTSAAGNWFEIDQFCK